HDRRPRGRLRACPGSDHADRPSVRADQARGHDLRAAARRLDAAREERRLSLADPDAECGEAVASAASAQLVQERDDEPRAAHPERVTESDRTAVHVHLPLVETKLADDDERLRGERLVQLDEVDLFEADAGALEQL